MWGVFPDKENELRPRLVQTLVADMGIFDTELAIDFWEVISSKTRFLGENHMK